jgi:hypothetical protein
LKNSSNVQLSLTNLDHSRFTISIRCRLQALVAEYKSTPTDELDKDIDNHRSKIADRLRKWRKDQQTIMPGVADYILRDKSDHIENEPLFLPSYFTADVRREINATELGEEEGQLREGAAFDALGDTRNAVKVRMTLNKDKAKSRRGVAQNTRMRRLVTNAEKERDLYIRRYNDHRRAMINLGVVDENDKDLAFPPLEVKDTLLKSTKGIRQLGDSRRVDGSIWAFPKHDKDPGPSTSVPEIGTQMSPRRKGILQLELC